MCRLKRGVTTAVAIAATGSLGLTACDSLRRSFSNDDAGTVTADAERRVQPTLTVEQLLDPTVCRQCHPGQYDEWASSMHAYASFDPVFLAMNALGQEQTEGRLGNFCVQCHAPLAVAYELTTDGLNLDQVPAAYQGVSCYFCHNVTEVTGSHNNPLRLAFDTTMRGPFTDPARVAAHGSAYSSLLDTERLESSAMCGSCHDVALQTHFAPAELALERTFEEWQGTLFNTSTHSGGLSCNGCHMPTTQTRTQSAVGPYPTRISRRHDFEGVDVALTPFNNRDRQRVLVQQFLDTSLLAEVCVSREGLVSVTLENAAGHNWPSGASHDRLAWLEVRVFDPEGLVYLTHDPETETSSDASVLGVPAPTLTDHAFDQQGDEAHFFWQIAEVKRDTLLGTASRDPQSPAYHRERKTWLFDAQQVALDNVERVELTVKLRPIKLAVLRELQAKGHLSAQVVDAMPTFELLPQRCHSLAEANEHREVLVGANTSCDPTLALHRTTLTWNRAEVARATSNVREIVLEGSTAKCFAHPTYIPPSP